MTGKPAMPSGRAHATETAMSARVTRWTEIERPRLKAAVRAEVERRGLASFMNATRWQALRDAVQTELRFPPAFQVQSVLGDREPPWDVEAVSWWGAWSELDPFFDIEWLRILPRYRGQRGRLVADEWVDCTDAFRDLLIRLHVPHREDEAGTFWIYGYASVDPATLTSPAETLT